MSPSTVKGTVRNLTVSPSGRAYGKGQETRSHRDNRESNTGKTFSVKLLDATNAIVRRRIGLDHKGVPDELLRVER